MKNIFLLAIIATSLSFGSCNAQNSTSNESKDSITVDTAAANALAFIKTLTETNIEELGDQQLMMDGKTTPIYMTDGKRIMGMEVMQLMMTGKFTPQPYTDENKKLKAFVMRASTKEEEEKMKSMQAAMSGKSELVGTEAKPFSVYDMSGKNYSNETLKGKVVVLNFWFVECKPCVMEIPDLNELVEKYKGKDVVFLGIAVNKKEQIKSFLKTTPFGYTLIPDSKAMIGKFGVQAFPTHMVINIESKIAFAVSGLSSETVHNLDEAIAGELTK